MKNQPKKSNPLTMILLFILTGGIIVWMLTQNVSAPPQSPTLTPNVPPLDKLNTIEWVESVPVYTITPLEEGGTQALVEIMTSPQHNNMDDITRIYTYVLEDIFQSFTQPAPLFISIVVDDGTQKTIYEQLPPATQLSQRPLDR